VPTTGAHHLVLVVDDIGFHSVKLAMIDSNNSAFAFLKVSQITKILISTHY